MGRRLKLILHIRQNVISAYILPLDPLHCFALTWQRDSAFDELPSVDLLPFWKEELSRRVSGRLYSQLNVLAERRKPEPSVSDRFISLFFLLRHFPSHPC